MMGMRAISGMAISVTTAFSAACQVLPPADGAAALHDVDAEARATVKSAIARSLGRADIYRMDLDLEGATTVAAPPPPLSPLEDRSLAKPELFDVVFRSGACALLRRETGETIALDGVACRPARR